MNLKVKAKNISEEKQDLFSHQDVSSEFISDYTGLANAVLNLIFFIPKNISLLTKKSSQIINITQSYFLYSPRNFSFKKKGLWRLDVRWQSIK